MSLLTYEKRSLDGLVNYSNVLLHPPKLSEFSRRGGGSVRPSNV